MAINLPNGRKISNVVISTALGPSGGGMVPYNLLPSYRSVMRIARRTGTAIFSKSATRFKRRGNFILGDPRTWKYVQRIRGSYTGMLNAYGLTNEGVEVEASKILQAIKSGYNVIPNFFPEFSKGKEVAIRETLEATEIYSRILGNRFSAMEINYSCPNDGCDIRANTEACSACTQAVKNYLPWLFLIAKIGYDHPHEFAYEQQLAGADAIHGINTIRYHVIFNKPSPYGKKGGGVSGGPAKLRAMEYNKHLPKVVSIPLIFGCGVEDSIDVRRYMDMGADSVSICSLVIRRSRTARGVINLYNNR
jgi:dihydroorotate dehydrogenase (NAD+) catalytic subunit